MVDEAMAKDLRSFGKKILIMGDPGQLPPVNGQGAFTNRTPDVFLHEIHRQAAESPILELATLARRGDPLPAGYSQGNIRVLPLTKDTQPLIYRTDTQPICGLNRVRWTYTQRIRTLLRFEGRRPAKDEKLICCRNNRKLGFFNGGSAVLHELKSDFKGANGSWEIDVQMEDHQDVKAGVAIDPFHFDNHFMFGSAKRLAVPGMRFDEFDWGYVLTCHKAQGSSWDHVTIIDDSGSFRENRHLWLYTAITRAETGLTILTGQLRKPAMALFERNSPLKPNQAYLKMGIYGNAGTGKTYTGSKVAIGLAEYIKEKQGKLPPVFFIDTETGSTWAKPWFAAARIEFIPVCTRAFSDLKQAVLDAEKEQAILIIDSITHFWIELCLTFARQRKRKDNRLEFQDYGAIKPMWATFTEAYLNSKAHIILCGRAGNTYEYQEKEDGGKKELISTGTKMKAESEMGYEPSLLVEMIAEKSMERKKKLTIRKGYVVKDRSTLLDGREFINPTFKVFLPHIEILNIGGEHVGVDTARNSAALFDSSGRPDFDDMLREQETAHLPGRMEEAIPYYRTLIERHNEAMLAGDVPAAMKIREEGHELAVKVNGGDAGICGGPDAPAYVLERATAAPPGTVPLWGQTGSFTIDIDGMPVRIEQDGIFGTGSLHMTFISRANVSGARPGTMSACTPMKKDGTPDRSHADISFSRLSCIPAAPTSSPGKKAT
jgi:hypothetical protein